LHKKSSMAATAGEPDIMQFLCKAVVMAHWWNSR